MSKESDAKDKEFRRDSYWNKERLEAHAAPHLEFNPEKKPWVAIVLECARFADEYVADSFGVHYSVGDEMKKHFGIEKEKNGG